MSSDGKRKSLIFLALTVLATILIAAALPRLEFRAGIPLPGSENRSAAPEMEIMPLPPISVNTLVVSILGVILGSVLLFSLFKVIQGTSWKEILGASRFAMGLALVALVFLIVLFVLGDVQISTAPMISETQAAPLPLQGLELGPMPPGLLWLAWIGVGLTGALLVAWIVRWQVRRSRARDGLALEAQSALQALKAGESFKNVIVRCYRDMAMVLQREHGIEMAQAMTAQEFERLLERRGVPPLPISQLTRLFETARYGYRTPTSEDEKEAIDCLNAIILYSCNEKRPG